ncbi:MAG TPA: hypothetical protein VH350_13375 [Candidatus Sulfotelmatobacter sp.]|jgi:hypothetical protein|nr:hypothetical protein [Candidatus Sulfotelmatobacter sp.]
MLPRVSLPAFAAILILSSGCNKEQPAPAKTVARSERVQSLEGTTQTVLQKTFTLKTSASFPFEIPAHAIQPHLHGIFQSFVGQLHGTSDNTANIDFLILNSEQADSAGSAGSDALFSVEASHNQAVNFDLPPSYNQPVTYYLVFRNSESSKASKFVDASFRVDF